MAGIKLYHPTIRPAIGAEYAVYVVETLQSYPVPYACPLCERMEVRKSLHLRIGPDGYVIVSPEIWEALAPVMQDSGLVTDSEVPNPPPVTVGAVELRKQDIIHHPLNLAKKWAGKYNPGRSKYESRDRLLEPLKGLIIPEIAFKQRKP